MIPKFRAWHKENKNMYEVKGVSYPLRMLILFRKNLYVEDLRVSFDDVVVMQATGLFDKNGKEIFEGDVIRCEHRRTGTVFSGEVKYDNRYGFWGVTDRRFKDLSAIPAAEVTYNGYISDSTFCEVIGNIYENPELEEIIRG